ncbi:MAG TPA: acetamidase/formamidase family protein [Chloroflexota bacterium]|nr:acetamidase/formamidase family protein [Chloroflexota bacterium]
MATHQIDLSRDTVHGPFDRHRAPVLTVASGDTVIYETLSAGWERGRGTRGFERDEGDQGHALSGPVAVAGAEPGDVLQVDIVALHPADHGWTWAGPWRVPGLDVHDEVRIDWEIDPDGRIARAEKYGLLVPIRPFMGVMGNAPAEPGPHDTGPPRSVGGNLDCRELVPGSCLFLPVAVEGALFSVGDGHAAQADGEVSGTAVECAMERVELRLTVRKDLRFTMPEAITPAGYITIGLGATLDEAMQQALGGMLDHLQQSTGLDRHVMLALASLVVDLRVTQIVNGTVGVHALLPPDAFQQVRL